MTPTTIKQVQAKVHAGCSCGNKNCFSGVPITDSLALRNMMELTERSTVETFLAGKLDSLARRGQVTHNPTAAGVHQHAERERDTYDYSVCGVMVCASVFMYAHDCTRYMLHKVHAGCTTAAEHHNAGTLPWNAVDDEEVKRTVPFVKTFC